MRGKKKGEGKRAWRKMLSSSEKERRQKQKGEQVASHSKWLEESHSGSLRMCCALPAAVWPEPSLISQRQPLS